MYPLNNILLVHVGMKMLSFQKQFHDPLPHCYHEAPVYTASKYKIKSLSKRNVLIHKLKKHL